MSAEDRGDLAELLDRLEALMVGPARGRIVEGILAKKTEGERMRALRAAMSSHTLRAGGSSNAAGEVFDLARPVRRLDAATRRDGFRVLHAWSHRTHTFTDDIVPVLLLDFLARAREGRSGVVDSVPDGDRATLAIALDAYLLHLLALCAMRAWDSLDPDETLDRLTRLVEVLQGEHGSGHRFVSDAETLLIYALSQFHPDEHAYDRIVDKILTLDEARQRSFAAVSAGVLGTHLRWGFWLMYDRDPVRMRRDNVGDYPWLLNSVLTLLRWYAELRSAGAPDEERLGVAQSLLQGLAADPWAFTGSAPPALAEHAGEYGELVGLLREHGSALVDDIEAQRPTKERYAPLSLHFNFPHNTLVAIVTLALLEGRPQPLPINALLLPELDEPPPGETQESLARALMAFSRGSPDRLGYRGAMLVAYDPHSGMRSHAVTVKTLRKVFG